MMREKVCAAVFAAALAVMAAPTLAQDSADGEDQVVARVDGEPIHRSDVLSAAKSIVDQYPGQVDQLLPLLLDRVITMRLVGNASKKAGLEDDPEFQRRLDELTGILMQEMYLGQKVAEAATDERLQARYQAFVEANPPQAEVHARHILLEEEDQAKGAIERLDGGADFAELARELSVGPSGPRGGDLGYFSEGQMVEPFSVAAFALEPGSYTKEPVQTQFGWHVIKVEDKRDSQPAPFEDVEDQLREELSQEVIAEVVAGLREEAEIELLLPEPAPLDSSGEETAPATEGDQQQ